MEKTKEQHLKDMEEAARKVKECVGFKRASAIRDAAIIAAFEAGFTNKEIGYVFGITGTCVGHVKRKHYAMKAAYQASVPVFEAS